MEKENLLVASIFSLFHNVFYRTKQNSEKRLTLLFIGQRLNVLIGVGYIYFVTQCFLYMWSVKLMVFSLYLRIVWHDLHTMYFLSICPSSFMKPKCSQTWDLPGLFFIISNGLEVDDAVAMIMPPSQKRGYIALHLSVGRSVDHILAMVMKFCGWIDLIKGECCSYELLLSLNF